MHLREFVVPFMAGAFVAVCTLPACSSSSTSSPSSASPDASSDSSGSSSDAALSDATLSDAAPRSDGASANDAERAYAAIEGTFVKALQLAFDGFNSASGGTIALQSASGDKAGTITVQGTVDQGGSSTKKMTLDVALSGYSDDGATTCQTQAQAPAAFELTLANIPTGTLSGTLKGTYALSGNVSGDVLVNVAFAGPIRANAADSAKVERTPAATHITGTVTAGAASYTVDVTR